MLQAKKSKGEHASITNHCAQLEWWGAAP